jgi:hypothetical protein
MGAHDGRVEHLDEMGGRTHGGERIKEGFENAGLAQLRIPIQSSQGFRFDVGRRSDLIPATVPK